MFSRLGSETRASEVSNPALIDFFDCVSVEWQERQKDLDFQIFEGNLSSRGLGERRFRSNTFRRMPNKISRWNRRMFTFLPKSIFSDCSCSGYCNHLESRDAAKTMSKSFSTLWNYLLVEVSASSDVGQWQDTHQKSAGEVGKAPFSPFKGIRTKEIQSVFWPDTSTSDGCPAIARRRSMLKLVPGGNFTT